MPSDQAILLFTKGSLPRHSTQMPSSLLPILNRWAKGRQPDATLPARRPALRLLQPDSLVHAELQLSRSGWLPGNGRIRYLRASFFTLSTRKGLPHLSGSHRLLCGDSIVATDVARVLGGVAPHLYQLSGQSCGGAISTRIRASTRASPAPSSPHCQLLITQPWRGPARCRGAACFPAWRR